MSFTYFSLTFTNKMLLFILLLLYQRVSPKTNQFEQKTLFT